MISIEKRVWWVLQGRPDHARLPPPQYGPLIYSSIAREIRNNYDHAPDTEPELIVRAEGFTFAWAPVPGCGCATIRAILVRPVLDLDLRRLLVFHERAHGWFLRRKLFDASESDAWHLTSYTSAPHAILLPLWFRVAADLIEAA